MKLMIGFFVAVITVSSHLITAQVTAYRQSVDQLLRVREDKERWGQVEVRMSSSDTTWYPVCHNADVFTAYNAHPIGSWLCESRLGLNVSWAEIEQGELLPSGTQFAGAQCPDNRTCTFNIISDCAINRALFVYCPAPDSPDLSLRLTGGPDNRRGRLEMLRNGEWMTFCGNEFDSEEAQVACRQLGFNASLAERYYSGALNADLSPYVFCEGDETRLIECPHQIVHHPHSCEISSGVECRLDEDYSPRLGDRRNLPVPNGRLDVKVGGEWMAVCGIATGGKEAEVACRQMGLPSTFARVLPRSVNYAAENISDFEVWVSCTREEAKISECFTMLNLCTGPVGIACSDVPDYQVRLAGEDGSVGRLEFNIAQMWGTVCDDSITQSAAQVVCRQLGFVNALPLIWPTEGFGQADPDQMISLSSVKCSGNEGALENCTISNVDVNKCTHVTDVVISCKSVDDIDVPMRLVGGPDNSTGRLELFMNGQWGLVNKWTSTYKLAKVACRQMGLPFGDPDILTNPTLETLENRPYFLHGVSCSGTERHLLQCQYSICRKNTCLYPEQTVIRCRDEAETKVPWWKVSSTTAFAEKTASTTAATSGEIDLNALRLGVTVAGSLVSVIISAIVLFLVLKKRKAVREAQRIAAAAQNGAVHYNTNHPYGTVYSEPPRPTSYTA